MNAFLLSPLLLLTAACHSIIGVRFISGCARVKKSLLVVSRSFKRLKLFEDTVDLIDLTARCIDRTASAVPINLFIQSATTHLPVNNA